MPHAGCTFDYFRGDEVIRVDLGDLTLVNSTFRANHVDESVIVAHSTALVRITDTTIERESVAPSLVTELALNASNDVDPVFYADELFVVTQDWPYGGGVNTTQSELLTAWPSGKGLAAEDPFLVSMETVRPQPAGDGSRAAWDVAQMLVYTYVRCV